MAVEVEIGDARLDQHIGVALVDLEDPVHPLQVEHDAAGQHRRGAAIAEVLAGRDRIDRDLQGVGDAHHRLNFLDVRGRHGGGDHPLFGLAVERRIGVAIEVGVLIGGEHPVLADGGLELGDRLVEVALADARGKSHRRYIAFS